MCVFLQEKQKIVMFEEITNYLCPTIAGDTDAKHCECVLFELWLIA